MFRFNVVAKSTPAPRNSCLRCVRILLITAPDGALQRLDVYRPGLARELRGASHYFVGVPAHGEILRNTAGFDTVFAHPGGRAWLRREADRWLIGSYALWCHPQFEERDAAALGEALCAAYRHDHPDTDFEVVGAATSGWLRAELSNRGFAVIKLRPERWRGGWSIKMLFVRQVCGESAHGYRRLIWARWIHSDNTVHLTIKVDGARRGYELLETADVRDGVNAHNEGRSEIFSSEGLRGLSRLLVVESLSAA